MRFPLSSLALFVLVPLAAPQPAPSATAPAPAQQPQSQRKKTDLEVQMDRMGKAWRTLSKQAVDPSKNDSSLELVATVSDWIAALPKLAS